MVAIKLLLAVDEHGVQRFRQEVQLLGSLRHPNIVSEVWVAGSEAHRAARGVPARVPPTPAPPREALMSPLRASPSMQVLFIGCCTHPYLAIISECVCF